MVTSGTRNISKALSTSKNFNRISRANTVTGTRNIFKAWSFSIALVAPISSLAALATSPKIGRLQKVFNCFSRTNTVTSDACNISKAWFFWIAFLAPLSWLAELATSPKLGRFQSHVSHQYYDCGTRNISQSKAWSTSKNFNRISFANIVTSGTGNISNGCSNVFNRISAF